jgi:biopolymer transport protein ExbD
VAEAVVAWTGLVGTFLPVQLSELSKCTALGANRHRLRIGLKPLKPRFSSLPSFGLFCSSTVVFSVFSIGLILTLQFPPSRGIRVNLAQAVPNLHLAESLVVRIGFAGRGLQPNLHLNSQLVPWEKLGSTLQESLKLHPDWVVYVESDPDVDWQHVADVMDISRSAHAKVVLLTMPSSDKR